MADLLNIPIGGERYEPVASSFRAAPAAKRKEYWRLLGEFALTVKRDEVRRAIGADGKKLTPTVRQATERGHDVFYPLPDGRKGHYYQAARAGDRPEDGDGPPLIPHYGESRTSRLLALHVMLTGFTLFWRADRGRSWKTILGYHAYRRGARKLPVRDVLGISPAGQRKILGQRAAIWRRLEPKPRAKTPPKPPAVAPKAAPARVPLPARPAAAAPPAGRPPKVVHLGNRPPKAFSKKIQIFGGP